MPSTSPPPTPVYGFGSLGWWRERGVTHVHFYCVAPDCRGWDWHVIGKLIERYSPNMTAVMLARAARCRCGRRGAHVEPASPPVHGQPGWLEWMAAERRRCLEFIEQHPGDS